MHSKLALIIGNDYVSKALVSKVLDTLSIDRKKLVIILDNSSSLKRIVSLIKKKRISLGWLFKLMIARVLQQVKLMCASYSSSDIIKSYSTLMIESNADLNDIIDSNPEIKTYYCFRAGLVINKHNVNKANFINFHCASIPRYAGLMSISKALENKDYEQECVMHKVVQAIDSGEVIKTRKYVLSAFSPYWKNELNAYSEGAELLKEELSKCIK